MASPATAGSPARAPRAFVPFRVLAWATGVVLAFQTFVGLPAKYLVDVSGRALELVDLGWVVHGWLYMVYVLTVLWLTSEMRWKPARALLVLLAGTVPLASFVAEHKVHREVEERVSARASAPAAPTQA